MSEELSSTAADELRAAVAEVIARDGPEWVVRARAALDRMSRDRDPNLRRAGEYWLAGLGAILELIEHGDGALEEEERRMRELLELAGLGAEAWCAHADTVVRETARSSGAHLLMGGAAPAIPEIEGLRRLAQAMRAAAAARRGSLAGLFHESRRALELVARTTPGTPKP